MILTGHTLDDQAETVLLNMLRGTGPRGLTGIPLWRPPNISRPMLRITRSETRELALLAGLPFFDDPMNERDGPYSQCDPARGDARPAPFQPATDERPGADGGCGAGGLGGTRSGGGRLCRCMFDDIGPRSPSAP